MRDDDAEAPRVRTLAGFGWAAFRAIRLRRRTRA
ncbi:hypothetical protein BFL34_01654 [Clavibacter michiganensis]|uniref:Uncharacterized protein n=1 Tax=Clavibacter michiganensis TaxID=28447 RepID=A0A251Y9A4_9MICO|nr:hypothetical protein BFL34_01654 [Clavibacter michiganensis]